ncbi:glycosyltransferase [Martelella sp. HB161492]|uniref:glycosyltransferase family 2 protein n=1 Tax=Martelella sp. HB161492 TaxID=2720726 RepID=UPI00158F9E8C|nr:glycosyltransferase [Martelella sp. HB161492]
MLTVIIECKNQEPALAHTLSSLVTGAVEGLVSDVIVLDHGSTDGTEIVAEAAGCRFHRDWDLKAVITSARGDWVMLVEPGARPLTGWVETVTEHMALEDRPARFTHSSRYRRSWLTALFRRKCPLETGLLMPKKVALQKAEDCGSSPFALAGRMSARRLSCEIIPAWVVERARA